MAERKVLNKYFPPDFDPAKIKRRKQAPDRQQVVRLMAPFNMRCSTCGEFIYKGRKFNARKETAIGETYYGIKIFRFYIKCTRCSAEITFKTDPKNTDYVAEHGATRNFEPWREAPKADDHDPLAHFAEEERRRELEASGLGPSSSSSNARGLLDSNGEDPMQSLEARQAESKREMEVLDALQDIRTRNARLDRVDTGDVLDRLERKRAQQLLTADQVEAEERRLAEEEDEALVRRYFSRAEDMGGEEEQRELTEALAGGGAPVDLDEEEEESQVAGPSSTPRSIDPSQKGDGRSRNGEFSNKPTKGAIIVKRALPLNGTGNDGDDDGDDVEPDAKSLLSERARALLTSASSTYAPAGGEGGLATVGPPPAKKKKTGPNAFGLVKKKKK